MIPQVKQWRVTTTVGQTYIVLAPTKLLAKLNFRHVYGYTDIKSIGLVRVKRRMPDGFAESCLAWRES
jgi:hypothetical protein